ncbi:MAG: DUF2303 family protein [Methylovulum sp.]|nr:DUF2303 family protein [Methylovulum sp.]
MFDKEAIKEIANSQAITAAQDGIATAGIGELVALPDNFKVHELEQLSLGRRRARGVMTTNYLNDFAAYTDKYSEDEVTNIFVDAGKMSATAVMNLGSAMFPKHADNLAILTLKKTAAFQALISFAGIPMQQDAAAEFLEDWATYITCFNKGGVIQIKHAIAAIRRITIESSAKLESAVNHLSATKSAFESIAASSQDPIPETIEFRCEPYLGLQERTFEMRVGVLTTQVKPLIMFRLIHKEQHEEDMAIEFGAQVTDRFDSLPGRALVMVGAYKAGA